MQFQRWIPRTETSWSWRVFKKHNDELFKMYTTFCNSHKYTYRSLKENNADWMDSPDQHFEFAYGWDKRRYDNLRDWSNSFNDLKNWINLNALLAISSNLETYIATTIPLALESDIGILYGTPRRIDGIEIIKHRVNKKKSQFDEFVISCTKGDWNSRISAYKKIFEKVPEYFESQKKDLEEIRKIRNDIAHAFGRDILDSRIIGRVNVTKIKNLSESQLRYFQDVVWRTVKDIDEHLYKNHIGDYESLLFYHNLYPKLNSSVHPNIRAVLFKKEIGQYGDVPPNKEYCKQLVKYYESI